MRIGPLIFLLLGLFVLGVGVRFLCLRVVDEPDEVLSLADLDALNESLARREELRRRRTTLQEETAQLRKEIQKLPDDGPAGKRAKAQKVLDETEKLEKQIDESLEKSEERAKAILDGADRAQNEQRGTWLRRGLLFSLLGLFWSIRAAVSLFAKREQPAPP